MSRRPLQQQQRHPGVLLEECPEVAGRQEQPLHRLQRDHGCDGGPSGDRLHVPEEVARLA